MSNISGTEYLNTVINKPPEGIVIVDYNGIIVSIDEAAQLIFQRSSQEMIDKPVRDFVPPALIESYFQLFSKQASNNELFDNKYVVSALNPDGSYLLIELSIHSNQIRSDTFYTLVLTNLSRSQEPENTLSYLDYIGTLMDTVLDGLITIDKQAQIQSFNRGAERIFGYTSNEVIGKNVNMLMPKPYRDHHDEYLRKYYQTGEKAVIGAVREIQAQRKDGSIFPMELGVNQMEAQKGVMFVGTIRDISERKAAENEIQSYINRLKISNEELDQFAYIASHDLKEPLRGLSNNALFLMEDYTEKLDEQGISRLNRIGFLCSRMENLVDSLLYYSRLGRQEYAIESTDLNNIINEIRLLLIDPDRDSCLDIVIPESLPTIICDVPRTTELFRNLISNGIKYNQCKNKIIEIGVVKKVNPFNQHHEDRVFYVKDNGIGIASQFFDDIFRIFKRLNEEDEKVRGTGVGLTFVKRIVERHNGHIWLESEPPNGSCFFFTLNISKDSV